MRRLERARPSVTRTLVLVLIGLFCTFWLAVLLGAASIAGSIFGWNLGPDGRTLIYVTPGGPAAKAGVEKGDRVDWPSLPLVGRANLALVQQVEPGTRLPITIHRRGVAHEFVIDAEPWGDIEVNAVRLFAVAGLVLTVLGIILVYLRPSRMTWGFLLSFLPYGDTGYMVVWGQHDPASFVFTNVFTALLNGLSVAGILIFVSRFPADRARGPLEYVDRLAVPLGVIAAALGTYVTLEVLLSPEAPHSWLLFANQYLSQALFVVVAFAALIAAFVLTNGSDRQRVVPVLLAFGAFVAMATAQSVYQALYTNEIGAAIITCLTAASMIALAVAVAQGVVRHRVIDVSFAISRTLVYTVLTSLIVGVFVLIDFVSSKVLEHLQIALVLEAAAALAFGIWLNTLHSRIDHFVDRVLFRRRHLAQARLQRAGKTVTHSESASFIDEIVTLEACDALDLASAAIFRREGGDAFERVRAHGWGGNDVSALTRDDHLVICLLAELEPVDIPHIRWPRSDIPGGLEQPLLAVPVVLRHELLGFVLYGGHTGGEAIDPDERRTLVSLAQAAAGAYDHIRSNALIAEADRLRAQNALLEHDQNLLREMLHTLGAATQR
jgi:GAF domain